MFSFSHMEATFIWGIVLSTIICAVAVAAEGRGRHALKVLLGMAPRTENLNAYDDVPRPDVGWDLVGYINDPRLRTGEVPVRAIAAPEVVPLKALPAIAELPERPANLLRAPEKMPPTVRPRAREAVPASG